MVKKWMKKKTVFFLTLTFWFWTTLWNRRVVVKHDSTTSQRKWCADCIYVTYFLQFLFNAIWFLSISHSFANRFYLIPPIFIDFHVFSLLSTWCEWTYTFAISEIIEHQWKSVEIIGNHCKSLTSNDKQWKSSGNQWKSMKINEHQLT